MVADIIDFYNLDAHFYNLDAHFCNLAMDFCKSPPDGYDGLGLRLAGFHCCARYLGCAGVCGVDSNRYQRAGSVSVCLLMTS